MVRYVDKTRTGIPGHPELKGVRNESGWGAHKASERYGHETKVHDGHAKGLDGADWLPQHGDHRPNADYNDVKDPWLRGAPSAAGERKPEYERSRGYRSPSHAGVGRMGGETGDHAVGNYSNEPMRQGPNPIRGKHR